MAVSSQIVNVPNLLTLTRFILSVVVFVLIPFDQFLAAMIVFIIAASTDWVDGWWARKYKQVTKVGRVFDPFVDKIIICGTFTFLAAEPNSGITPWMAVVVLGRELLVTSLRALIEQGGGDFSAAFSGKLKMVFQCVAAGASLLVLHYHATSVAVPPWLAWTLFLSVWIAILSTLQSGIEYIFAAAKHFRS